MRYAPGQGPASGCILARVPFFSLGNHLARARMGPMKKLDGVTPQAFLRAMLSEMSVRLDKDGPNPHLEHFHTALTVYRTTGRMDDEVEPESEETAAVERQIWKFSLEIQSRQVLPMPFGWKPVTLEVQNGEPYLWALVDPLARKVAAWIMCFGTGHPITAPLGEHLGTVLTDTGMVWHYFRKAASA